MPTAPSPRLSLQAAATACRLTNAELTQLQGWIKAFPELLTDPEHDGMLIGSSVEIAVKHIRAGRWLELPLERRLAPRGFKPL